MDTHTQAKTKRKMSLGLISLLFLLPALLFYAIFELWPIIQTIWYSLYDWNGIDESTFVGLRNYKTVFTDPDLYGSILHSFYLIIFFSIIPIVLGAHQGHEIQGRTRLRAGLPVPSASHPGSRGRRRLDLDAGG